MKSIIIFAFILFWITHAYGQKRLLFTSTDYILAMKHATDVMVTDVTSPVAASRYYAYITLAANETAALFETNQPRFSGFIRGLKEIAVEDSLLKKADPQLAVILAVYKSASRLLPSGYL